MAGKTYRILKRTILILLIILGAGYLTFLIVFHLHLQHTMLFKPIQEMYETPEMDHTEEITIPTESGEQLSAWYYDSPSDTVILSCQGNYGNIYRKEHKFRILKQLNIDVLFFDYRGYGKSQGTPSINGIHSDARDAYRFLVNRLGYDEQHIVAMGFSLGNGPAIYLAAQEEVGALIIIAPFSSVRDMAARIIPVWLYDMVSTNRINNTYWIQQVEEPKLFFHGKLDQTIPFSMSEKLFEVAGEPKYFFAFDTGDHHVFFESQQDEFIHLVSQFLTQMGFYTDRMIQP